MQNYFSFLTDKKAKKITDNLVDFFEKLPHLPERWRRVIVKVLPYFALIAGISSVISAIQNITHPQRFNHWLSFYSGISPLYFYLNAALSAVAAIIFLQAYQLLLEKKIEGWLLIFWATALGLLQNLLAIIFAWGGIAGTLFWGFVGFYLVYEVRSFYLAKKTATKKVTSSKKKNPKTSKNK